MTAHSAERRRELDSMAKTRGWWTLTTTTEPDDVDLENIAELIKRGFTEGEIVRTESDADDA